MVAEAGLCPCPYPYPFHPYLWVPEDPWVHLSAVVLPVAAEEACLCRVVEVAFLCREGEVAFLCLAVEGEEEAGVPFLAAEAWVFWVEFLSILMSTSRAWFQRRLENSFLALRAYPKVHCSK